MTSKKEARLDAMAAAIAAYEAEHGVMTAAESAGGHGPRPRAHGMWELHTPK